jgi:hypothetical protein
MYQWSYLGEDGQELGRSQAFADADAAEDWMGGSWSDLLEHGVEHVELHDHTRGRRVYRMGLRPSD